MSVGIMGLKKLEELEILAENLQEMQSVADALQEFIEQIQEQVECMIDEWNEDQ